MRIWEGLLPKRKILMKIWIDGLIKFLRHFVSHNRILTSIVLALLLVIFAKPTSVSILLALPLLILGEVVRMVSLGYIRKEMELTRDGPYSVTRNPLYLGNLFLMLGFVIIANQLILMGIYLALFYFIYDATIKEEEERLFELFGSRFEDYKNKVPRFFPRGSQWDSWSPFARKWVLNRREINTCFGIMLGVALAYLKKAIIS